MTDKEYKDYLDENIEDNYYDKKMLNNNSDFCKVSDLAKRFIEIDKEYGHSNWNLTQILANIRMTEHYSLEEIKLIVEDGHRIAERKSKMIDNAIILTKEEYENAKNNIRNSAYQKGAREFVEWLCRKSQFEEIGWSGIWNRDEDNKQEFFSIDEVLAEWQKAMEE